MLSAKPEAGGGFTPDLLEVGLTASMPSPWSRYRRRVQDVSPAQRMTWTGGMPLGLFKGVRRFTLTPEGDGSTRFHMREAFSGPLLPLIGRSMPDLAPSFERFAKGLKGEAERTG